MSSSKNNRAKRRSQAEWDALFLIVYKAKKNGEVLERLWADLGVSRQSFYNRFPRSTWDATYEQLIVKESA